MHHGLGQVELGLGQADELDGPGGGVGHHQGQRVGLPDVLAGQDDQSAGDEPGVLARLEHPGQPVEAGVGVRAPDRLDEGAHLVVVVVLAVVLEPGVAGPLHVLQRDRAVAGQGQGHLQGGEHRPGVAVGQAHQGGHRLRLGRRPLGRQAPGHHLGQLVVGQRLEPPQGRAGQQRGVDLEERVLGGGPDQHQQALLHRGEEGVLLGAVEPVDLVEEEDGAPPLLARAAGGRPRPPPGRP